MKPYRFLIIILLALGTMFPADAATEAQTPPPIPAAPLKHWSIKDVTSAGGEILGMDIEDNLVLLLRSRALELVDFSTPTHPVLLSRMDMPDETTDMAVRGRAAYVGVRFNGVHMIDFSNPRAPRERGLITTDTLKVQLGVEGPYLRLWAHYKGDGVVDILRIDKNPWQPEEAWDEDYRHTDRYTVIGTTALQIRSDRSGYHNKPTQLLARTPEDKEWRPPVLSLPPCGDGEEARLMVEGSRGCILQNRRLYLLDLGNPLKPVITGEVEAPQLEDPGYAPECTFTDRLLLIKGHWPTLIDIADPKHPRVIEWKAPRAYEHAWLMGNLMLVRCMTETQQAWFTAFDISNPAAPVECAVPIMEERQPIRVRVRGKMAYALTPQGELKILDCSNPAALRLRGSLPGMAPQNDTGDERLWEIQGSRMFIVDHEGVRVIDLADPDRPEILGTYHAAAQDAISIALGQTPQGKTIAWVANRSGRLEALDLAQPAGAALQGWIDLQGEPEALKIGRDHAYIGSDGTIFVIDIHQPKAPALIKTLTIQGKISALALTGNNLLLAATENDGLEIFDVKNPQALHWVGTYQPKSGYSGMAACGDLVFLAGPSLKVISMADPTHPRQVGSLPPGSDDEGFQARHVVLHGRTAFTPQLVDLANPAAPRWVETFKIGTYEDRCQVSAGRFVYFLNVLSWSGGTTYTLSAYNATNPLQPLQVVEYDRLISTRAMAADESENLFIADGAGGVVQLRMVEETDGKR